MSKRAVLLIVAILLLTSCFQQPKSKPDGTGPTEAPVATSQPSGWIAFSPKDGSFSVMLPGKPIQTSLEAPTTEGPGTPMYQLESGGFRYTIIHKDYPASFIESIPAKDKYLQMTSEKALVIAGGKLVSSKPLSLGDYLGREVTGDLDGAAYQGRSYLVKQRLYLLKVMMPADKADSDNAAKFFESFKVLPAAEARPL